MSLTFWHRAGVSSHTSFFNFAETCVFGKQSLGPDHCDLIAEALFLPKLQSYFAEFLRKSYLALLSILYLPTCVSLRYRFSLLLITKAFLGSMT